MKWVVLVATLVAGWSMAVRAAEHAPSSRAEYDAARARFLRLQLADENGNVPADGYINASRQREALIDRRLRAQVAGVTPSGWTSLGPSNIGGRVRAISPNPLNGNDILIGAATGGVWRTLDGGSSWHAINDFMGNLAIYALARDPSNPQIVYAGTGERGRAEGYGIFKSLDGGATWSLMPGTTPSTDPNSVNYRFFYVSRIAVSPVNPMLLLAASPTSSDCIHGGLLRSIDGGASWTLVYNRPLLDAKFDPNNPDRVVVAEDVHCIDPSNDFTTPTPSRLTPWGIDGGAVAVSLDAGATFVYPTARTRFEPASLPGRIELAWATATPGLVLAMSDSFGHDSAVPAGSLYYSQDSGQSWAFNSQPGHLLFQGYWSNELWIDPTDSRRVVAAGGWILVTGAGVDKWWLSNDALSWTSVDSPCHINFHAIVQHPAYDGTTNRTVFFANDGGVCKAPDIAVTGSPFNDFVGLSNGLAITQFYGGAGQTSAGYRLVGGAEGNGSLYATTSAPTDPWAPYWLHWSGDGGFTAVSPSDANTFYGEDLHAQLARTTSGGLATSICAGITDGCGAPQSNDIAPFILDPNNEDTMLVGANQLWRSTNVRSSAPGQPTWSAIKMPSGAPNNNYISAVAVAPGNSNLIWVGHNNGEIYCTTNGTSVSPAWTLVMNSPARYVMRITVDQSNPNRVFATYGGYTSPNVYELTDAIQVCKANPTATPRHGNLPSAPVRSLVRHPAKPNWLYVGTDVGVFASTDGGSNWSTTSDGPGNVRVDELFWMNASTLVAATHGRGMFRTVVGPGTLQFATAMQSVGETAGTVTVNVTRKDGSIGAVGVDYATVPEAGPGKATSGVDYVPASGTVSWNDGEIGTKSFTVTILGDAVVEGDETFLVSLSSPTGGAPIGSPSSNTVTIVDQSTPLRLLIPDGTSLKQNLSAYPETSWFALGVEPAKTYVIEAADTDGDLPKNAIGALGVFAPDVVSAPPEASVDCTAANGPRPPAVDVWSDGVRCVLRTAPAGPGVLLNKRPVYVKVVRMDPAAGGGAQFRIRAREATVYGRWVTAGFDYHVELENTTADAMCVEIVRYPASGLAYVPGPGWSGSIAALAPIIVPAFGAVKQVIPNGSLVGADAEGTLRINACGSPVNLIAAALHVSTYAFDPVSNTYIYYFTSTANDGKTRSTW